MADPRRACKACGVPIVWLRHVKTGEVVPVDEQTYADGNLEVVAGGTVRSVRPLRDVGQALPGLDDPAVDVPRYKSHFATCTEPDRFRKAAG